MGASCSGLHGFNLAGGEKHEKHSVAVIGDSTFAHSGITGIADIAYNRSNSTVIILDNSITGMTGHQQNPTTGKTLRGEPAGKIDLEALCRAVGFARVRVVDPNQLKEMDRVLKEELAAEEKRRQKRLRDHEKYLRQKERKKKIAEGQIVPGEPYVLVCQCCGETFRSIRPNAKFCTPACRQRFYRQQKRELPPSDAVSDPEPMETNKTA